jgi:predicted RNase H-like nuclease (RuvC/YqgF family)
MADGDQGELLLTYAELATRLGVSTDGARTRVRRQGWPVIAGNDGKARVRVLASDLPEQPRSRPEQTGVMTELLNELRRSQAEQVAGLNAQLHRVSREAEQFRSDHAAARSEAERHRAEAELLREQMAREFARVERLEAALALARKGWLERLLEAVRRK